MRWTMAVSCLLLAEAASAAFDVRWPDGERMTVAEVARRYENRTGRTIPQKRVWVVSDRFEPLRQPARPGNDNPPSGAPALPFLTQVNMVGDFVQTGDGNFVLISDKQILKFPDATLLGWVPLARVLTRTVCLGDDRTDIKIKSMVVNSLAYLKKSGEGEAARVLPPRIRLAPDPDGTDNGAFRFFDFYFVWGDTRPDSEQEGYALLGENPSFNVNAELPPEEFRKATRIIGWVRKSRLCFWRTREALQWDDQNTKRTEPARAYASRDLALADLDPGARPPASEDEVIVEKFADNRPVSWEPRRMRYPLLTIRVEKTQPLVHETHRNNILRRVGVIGDVFDENGKPVMDEQLRQNIRDDIIRTRQQLARTEILFVIDRTTSMEPWWTATAEAVKALLEQVKGADRSVAVGFCFYGDVYPSTEKEGKVANLEEAIKLGGVVPGRLFDARADEKELKEKLKELADTTRVIPGGTRPEMVYAGIEAGLLEAKGWSKNARKMLILIGDDGNHPLPAEEEQTVHKRIVDLCVPSDDRSKDYQIPWEFYALQVRPVAPAPADPSEPPDPTVLFKNQVNALVKRIKAKSDNAVARYFNTTERGQFLAEIEERYKALAAHAARQEEEIQRAQTGQLRAVTEIRDPEVVRILQSIAARQSAARGQRITLDDLLKGAQAFDERFVWELAPRTNVRQIRRMILVSGGELKDVLGLFEDFFTNPENPPSLEDLARSLIAVQSGDPNLKGKTDAEKLDALKVKFGFSFVGELMQLLGYDREAGRPRPKPDPDAERRLKQRLQKKFYLLQDLKAEKVRKYTQLTPNDEVNLKTEGPGEDLPAHLRRGFKRGDGSATWYWVDFDKEWP